MAARALFPVAILVAITFVVMATLRDARPTASADTSLSRRSATREGGPVLPASMPGTSRVELAGTVSAMTARLTAKPGDAEAVIHLSNALVRLQRVNNDGRAVIAAEGHLRAFLEREPGHYQARRTLATVLLSQHRFGEAIAEANRARVVEPGDAWNYGAIGDGYMELGDYDRAFEAFDRMGQILPGPPAYARTAYALEIKGDLAGALHEMQRAADGASPNDPESQAWHYTQVGDLLLQLGRAGEARLQYERAHATFPDHPLALAGLARIRIVDGDLAAARLMLQSELARTPTPDVAIVVGDLSRALGDEDGAEQYFRMAEQIERAGWTTGPSQPQALARFFADHDRNLPEAVALAEQAAASRRDIFTMDTLAWAHFKAGHLDQARRASGEALRTGTRDARILWHAAEIAAATGDGNTAKQLLGRVPAVESIADLAVRDGVKSLWAGLSIIP